MKIKFDGHQQTNREIDFTQDDQVRLFELMKDEFINHITYAKFTNLYYHYPTRLEKGIGKFCNDFGVDCEYDKDRVAFFTAVLDALKNPYQ